MMGGSSSSTSSGGYGGDSSQDEDEGELTEQTDIDEYENQDEGSKTSPAGGGGGKRRGSGGVTGPVATRPEEDEPDEDEEGNEVKIDNIEDKDKYSDSEDSHESEDEQEEDDDEQEVKVIHPTGPWDSLGWGVSPVIKRIEEVYRGEVDVEIVAGPFREFLRPEELREEWEKTWGRYDVDMPLNTTVWEHDPPTTNELSIRAYATAVSLDHNLAKEYLRRLRINSLVEGTNIEDKEVLLDTADNVGYDVSEFEEEFNDREEEMTKRNEYPPTIVKINNESIELGRFFDFDDFDDILTLLGSNRRKSPRPLPEFVGAHGPVTTEEVAEVYGYVSEKTVKRLKNNEKIDSKIRGGEQFWVTR